MQVNCHGLCMLDGDVGTNRRHSAKTDITIFKQYSKVLMSRRNHRLKVMKQWLTLDHKLCGAVDL